MDTKKRKLAVFLPVWFFWFSGFSAFASEIPAILSMKERAELRDRWLGVRLQRVIPELMRREGFDMWIIVAREYNEDPVFRTLAPATWLAARRRTVLVFFDKGDEVERLAVARYDIGEFFQSAWDPEGEPDQWKRLAQIVGQRDPRRIGINRSSLFALADGITASELEALQNALPEALRDRLAGAEKLSIGWLETRTAEEMEVYSSICRIAHAIIAEGLSDRVIQPGFTTTADVQWWYRERIRELKLVTWFHPSVSIQRADSEDHSGDFSGREDSEAIQRGDLIHVDFGITYLGLNTDTQQHAYVLRAGEEKAPAGLVKALQVGNRLQDILTAQFSEGRSGNEILSRALAQARDEGLEARIYTHPIGYHGHGAGSTIGLWDRQEGVPGRGDYPLYANTAHSIELNAASPIPEWNGKKVRIMLEEDAFFDGTGVRYIDGRQTELLLVR